MKIEIVALRISPGHNYKGRHGAPPESHPLLTLPEIECVAGRGIRGDRYFNHAPDFKGQITFITVETLAEVQGILKLPSLDFGAARRNVLTRGVDLNSLIGATFELGGVTFEGVEECKPCYWMNAAIAPGAEKQLRGRGGLRAKILGDGVLKTGWADLRVIQTAVRPAA
ncbi:MAG: molybdenum cofactor biosysynthesis protein [Verrucomicrobia bacterium]|nr:MAG: molybdenum cofactor biosysynthesis protein [Verrucomicrobiota bacterium]